MSDVSIAMADIFDVANECAYVGFELDTIVLNPMLYASLVVNLQQIYAVMPLNAGHHTVQIYTNCGTVKVKIEPIDNIEILSKDGKKLMRCRILDKFEGYQFDTLMEDELCR